MARPVKQGLDYFPFDVDFFSDEKLYAISGEFGIKGEITTIKLLCAVYRNGYYAEWNEMLKFKLIKELPGVSVDLLDQIIRRLVKWNFFDKNLFDSASILTSKGIQQRYQNISAKMHRKNVISEYSLIEPPQQMSAKRTHSSSDGKTTKRAPVRKLVAKGGGSKQSPKESVSSTASVSGLTSATHEDPEFPAHQPYEPIQLEQSIKHLREDKEWIASMRETYQIADDGILLALIERFRHHCINHGRTQHSDMSDVKRHFKYCLNRRLLESEPTIKGNPFADNTPRSFKAEENDFGGVDY